MVILFLIAVLAAAVFLCQKSVKPQSKPAPIQNNTKPPANLTPKQRATTTNATLAKVIIQKKTVENSKTLQKKQISRIKISLPVPLPSTIPGSLSILLSNGHFFKRLKAVRQLGRNLTNKEISLLYALMDKKDDVSLPADKMNTIKNDVVNALMEQHKLPTDLTHNLIVMYKDREHNDVWRDYCIQHLGTIYQKLGDQKEKTKLMDVLWQATEETNLSIAGTALISLQRNIDASGSGRERVAAKALTFAEDSSCAEPARITALQICAELSENKVLDTARSLINAEASIPLRMSAIAAVGTLGDATDLPMLEIHAISSDIRLITAAKSALKRLRQ